MSPTSDEPRAGCGPPARAAQALSHGPHGWGTAPPRVLLVDPTPARARAAIEAAARTAGLGPEATADLVLATSEVVANAVRHGRDPVKVGVWVVECRVVVSVTDSGDGPAAPLEAGFPVAGPGVVGPGLGLWIASQLVDVTRFHDAHGFSVTMASTPGGREDPPELHPPGEQTTT